MKKEEGGSPSSNPKFSPQSYFMEWYHRQEKTVGIIQGITSIYGLIRGSCILMRRSATRLLQHYRAECWPGWKQGPQDGSHFLQRLISSPTSTANAFPKQQAKWLRKEISFVFATAVLIYWILRGSPTDHNILRVQLFIQNVKSSQWDWRPYLTTALAMCSVT